MELQLFFKKRENRYLPESILNIYKIWRIYILLYWNFYIYQTRQTFNIQDPLEFTLAKIYSFYEVFGKVDDDIETKLVFAAFAEEVTEIYLFWWEDMWDYWVSNDWGVNGTKEVNKEFVGFWYSQHQSKDNLPWLESEYDDIWRKWKITCKEYYVLMQIYFWIYEDGDLRKELEEKERKWKYKENETMFLKWRENKD